MIFVHYVKTEKNGNRHYQYCFVAAVFAVTNRFLKSCLDLYASASFVCIVFRWEVTVTLKRQSLVDFFEGTKYIKIIYSTKSLMSYVMEWYNIYVFFLSLKY